jgi:hypothetical protein
MSSVLAQYSPACKEAMQMQSNIERNKKDPAAQYADSIEFERAARQAMEAHPPGSRERAQAWHEWSAAIVRTNQAWRRLSSSDMGRSRQPGPGNSERPHAAA